MSARDGGPAFPVSDVTRAQPSTPDEMRAFARGMSLRDYFAAAALQGMWANSEGSHGEPDPDVMAATAYEYADAMLEARE